MRIRAPRAGAVANRGEDGPDSDIGSDASAICQDAGIAIEPQLDRLPAVLAEPRRSAMAPPRRGSFSE